MSDPAIARAKAERTGKQMIEGPQPLVMRSSTLVFQTTL